MAALPDALVEPLNQDCLVAKYLPIIFVTDFIASLDLATTEAETVVILLHTDLNLWSLNPVFAIYGTQRQVAAFLVAKYKVTLSQTCCAWQ